jgi:hypothetical protein
MNDSLKSNRVSRKHLTGTPLKYLDFTTSGIAITGVADLSTSTGTGPHEQGHATSSRSFNTRQSGDRRTVVGSLNWTGATPSKDILINESPGRLYNVKTFQLIFRQRNLT